MKRLFLRTRLRGIWVLLTKPYFVVLGANDEGGLSARYNVNHASFRLMATVIDPAYEEKEGQAAALREAQQILGA